MRQRLGGVVLITLAAASSAMAADIGISTTAPPIPIYNWMGLYFGGNIGGGWSALDETVVIPFAGGAFPAGTSFATNNLSGILGGVQGGFNWQFNSAWLVGLEGDYMWADLAGSSTSVSIPSPTVTTAENAKITDIALATARLGYTMNNWLFYAKGGGAWGQGSATSGIFRNGTAIDGTSSNTSRTGWTIGAGIEWGFSGFFKNYSAKIEYNHVDFGTQSVSVYGTSGPIAGTFSTVNGHDTVDIVKAGVNYRFNIPGMP